MSLDVLLLVLLLLAALGMPLFAVILGVAIVGLQAAGYEQAALTEFYGLGDTPGLMAIPLFTLAGYLLSESGAPKRLVRLSDALLGFLPGGLAMVAIVACALFTAFTGASGVTIIAMGALLYPALIQAGYPQRYALGLVTVGGSLGLLFAPSLPLILYGFVAGQLGTQPSVSVQDMFLAGLLPGLVMMAVLMLHAVWVGRAVPRTRRGIDAGEVWAALKDARWELPLPVIVLSAVYEGVLAVSEVSALTALYVLFVTTVVRREVALRRLPSIMAEAMRMVGAILLILGAAKALSNWFIDQDVPGALFTWVSAHIDTPLEFLLALNLFLLLVGMLVDIFSAIVILTPLLVPLGMHYGVHPAHLGVVMLANLEIGYMTPPVGINLFIASYRFKVSLLTVVRATLPFLLLLGIALIIITRWPALSTGLLPGP
ncbi:TRAP transporter large permease subunit [Silanimonas sp.]|uniref:TRAP transporter large permease n=1 Tax=Silanimonas sp. TaxID=1929290 RepID=UPI0022BE2996|nr:TRAP transporter large permease subunit [Silanimonas sp.]MCZ8113594.1 TRAP transporter large permease subunit [Silanimonas sp.]